MDLTLTLNRPYNIRGRVVVVCIPSMDGKLLIGTAAALMESIVLLGKHGASMGMMHVSGCSLITKARNSLVCSFLQSPGTDLMFIDSDINFKAADLARLVAVGTDHDITVGLYRSKTERPTYCVDLETDAQGNTVVDGPLMEVQRAPTGFMLIRRPVLERLWKDYEHLAYDFHRRDDEGVTEKHVPIFDTMAQPGAYIGEDYVFCDRARAAGFRIWADPSVDLTHTGTKEYGGSFYEQVYLPEMQKQTEAA